MLKATASLLFPGLLVTGWPSPVPLFRASLPCASTQPGGAPALHGGLALLPVHGRESTVLGPGTAVNSLERGGLGVVSTADVATAGPAEQNTGNAV